MRARAERERALVRMCGVLHAQRDRADRRAVCARELLRKAVGFGVDQEIDLTLPIQRDLLAAMARDAHEAETFEQRAELGGIGRGVLDELEAIRPHRVFERHVASVAGASAFARSLTARACRTLRTSIAACELRDALSYNDGSHGCARSPVRRHRGATRAADARSARGVRAARPA